MQLYGKLKPMRGTLERDVVGTLLRAVRSRVSFIRDARIEDIRAW